MGALGPGAASTRPRLCVSARSARDEQDAREANCFARLDTDRGFSDGWSFLRTAGTQDKHSPEEVRL